MKEQPIFLPERWVNLTAMSDKELVEMEACCTEHEIAMLALLRDHAVEGGTAGRDITMNCFPDYMELTGICVYDDDQWYACFQHANGYHVLMVTLRSIKQVTIGERETTIVWGEEN